MFSFIIMAYFSSVTQGIVHLYIDITLSSYMEKGHETTSSGSEACVAPDPGNTVEYRLGQVHFSLKGAVEVYVRGSLDAVGLLR